MLSWPRTMLANKIIHLISPPYLRIGAAILEASCRASPESNRDEHALVGRKQPTRASNGFTNKRRAYSVHSYDAISIILRMRRQKTVSQGRFWETRDRRSRSTSRRPWERAATRPWAPSYNPTLRVVSSSALIPDCWIATSIRSMDIGAGCIVRHSEKADRLRGSGPISRSIRKPSLIGTWKLSVPRSIEKLCYGRGTTEASICRRPRGPSLIYR